MTTTRNVYLELSAAPVDQSMQEEMDDRRENYAAAVICTGAGSIFGAATATIAVGASAGTVGCGVGAVACATFFCCLIRRENNKSAKEKNVTEKNCVQP